MTWTPVAKSLPNPGDTVIVWRYATSLADSIRVARYRGESRWASVPGNRDITQVEFWALPEEPR